MKTKYISEDNIEFETEKKCSAYENSDTFKLRKEFNFKDTEFYTFCRRSKVQIKSRQEFIEWIGKEGCFYAGKLADNFCIFRTYRDVKKGETVIISSFEFLE